MPANNELVLISVIDIAGDYENSHSGAMESKKNSRFN